VSATPRLGRQHRMAGHEHQPAAGRPRPRLAPGRPHPDDARSRPAISPYLRSRGDASPDGVDRLALGDRHQPRPRDFSGTPARRPTVRAAATSASAAGILGPARHREPSGRGRRSGGRTSIRQNGRRSPRVPPTSPRSEPASTHPPTTSHPRPSAPPAASAPTAQSTTPDRPPVPQHCPLPPGPSPVPQHCESSSPRGPQPQHPPLIVEELGGGHLTHAGLKRSAAKWVRCPPALSPTTTSDLAIGDLRNATRASRIA